jgi:hypothetical protein
VARAARLADDEPALIAELEAQLRRMKGAGSKIAELLAVDRLDPSAAGARGPGRDPVPGKRLRSLIERELDGRLGDVFAEFDPEPLAPSSLGQVHRARTRDGDEVAVKVQHPGVAEAIEADLRSLGLLVPIVRRLAPAANAGALLGELRERISAELDYELEAQHQRRLERRFRGHPHVRVPRARTDLSTRRVLITEYVEGLRSAELERLGARERDRAGELAFRFYFGLAWRDRLVAADPHPDNRLLCPDGRLCLLDFALLGELPADQLPGEREVMRAVVAGDAPGVRAALAALGHLPDPQSFDPTALLEHLACAGEWLLVRGRRRLEPGYAGRVVALGYPPRSPWLALMRRQRPSVAGLLLRRMELQLLVGLGELRAAADWAAIAAEHWAGEPPSSALGREDEAFFASRPPAR